MTAQPEWIDLSTDTLRLTAPLADPAGLHLAVRIENTWQDVALLRWGRLVVRGTDEDDPDGDLTLIPTEITGDTGGIHLHGRVVEAALGTCTFGVDLRRAGTREIEATFWAISSRRYRLVHFGGPTLILHDQFVQEKNDALFPGLEWLLADEQSSSTTNAAPRFARRTAPHPYKVTVPLMAVSSGNAAVGLWWDPGQLWCGAHAYIGAEFALPEADAPADGSPRANRLGLFVPPPGSTWVAENATQAQVPYAVPAGARLGITAVITAGPAARFTPPKAPDDQPARAHGSLTVLERWLATREPINPPPIPHTWAKARALCLQSYMNQCWDDRANAWHHTLADPSEPHYEPGVALQLWQAARRKDLADPERARAIVRAGVVTGRERRSHNAITHLDLAFSFGGLEEALHATSATLAELRAQQRPDGAFPFVPKEQRQQNLGRHADSSSGLTAEAALRLLRFARISGDEAAERAGLRALDYLRTQPRPEGAQTWELQVHVPDVLASAYGVAAGMEAYHLTAEEHFLDEAERWAFSGLPFIYLWNPLFRPIMRYGTIPVFGATFFDAQAWFGVLVQWNGLVYAAALLDLAAARPQTRWHTVAESVIACALQQQAPDGPLAGMYPDAYSVPRGDEEYTWWLTPTLLGHALRDCQTINDLKHRLSASRAVPQSRYLY